MLGIAISTIDPSSVASSTASVTFDSAIHLYLSFGSIPRAAAGGHGMFDRGGYAPTINLTVT